MAKTKTYTCAQLSDLQSKLMGHRRTLGNRLQELVQSRELLTFLGAILVRDAALQLTATCYALDSIDVTIDIARSKNDPQPVPFSMGNIGLQWECPEA